MCSEECAKAGANAAAAAAAAAAECIEVAPGEPCWLGGVGNPVVIIGCDGYQSLPEEVATFNSVTLLNDE